MEGWLDFTFEWHWHTTKSTTTANQFTSADLIKRSPYSSISCWYQKAWSHTTTTWCDWVSIFDPSFHAAATTLPPPHRINNFSTPRFSASNPVKSPFLQQIFNCSFLCYREDAKVTLISWVDCEFIVVHHCEYCIRARNLMVVIPEGQYFLEANVPSFEDVYQQFSDWCTSVRCEIPTATS